MMPTANFIAFSGTFASGARTAIPVTVTTATAAAAPITAAPTLCSVMDAAVSRRLRPGVIVNTFSVIASRTVTTGSPPQACVVSH